jgi:hypothetical protein
MIILPHRRKAFRGGGSFDPTSIAGLQLWLDPSDSSTLYSATSGGSLVSADGGIARIEDLSGNSRHATQTTAGKRPLRKTASVNGLDTALFQQTGGSWMEVSLSLTLSNGGSLFIVWKNLAVATLDSKGSACALCKFSSNGDGAHQPYGSPLNNYYESFGTSTRQSWAMGSFPSTTELYGITSGASTWKAYRDGVEVYTTNSFTKSNPNVQQIGTYDSGGGGDTQFSLWANLCEILIYDSALGTTDREAVEAYLMTKWGI